MAFINIGGIQYRVEEVERLIDDDGVTRLNGKLEHFYTRIKIDKDLDPQIKEVAKWHEVVHAILHNAGVEHDERIAIVLGYGIYQVLVDNKDTLAGWYHGFGIEVKQSESDEPLSMSNEVIGALAKLEAMWSILPSWTANPPGMHTEVLNVINAFKRWTNKPQKSESIDLQKEQ